MKTIEEILKVIAILEALLTQAEDEIEKEMDGQKQRRDYVQHSEDLNHLISLDSHKKTIRKIGQSLKEEFEQQLTIDEELSEPKKGRANLGKLRRGQRTQEAEYIIPILQALHDMGGTGRKKIVIDRVGIIMENTLNDLDRELLKSSPHSIRWVNAAQWARDKMVHKLGYLKSNSPRGFWEITPKGEAYLKAMNKVKG